ncbi:MAG: inositol oxygenase family protein, partial [Planctomycetaceae bacterium]
MSETHPLRGLDDWEQSLRDRYPAGVTTPSGPSALDQIEKPRDSFRNLGDASPPGVREFYRLNHRHQTLEYVRGKRADYGRLNRRQMGVWEALEFLNTLVDDSDPDADFSQIEHLLQTAEAIRADGHPDWF